ncbi:hypothetical protein [Candidatus Nitrospira bockiana]
MRYVTLLLLSLALFVPGLSSAGESASEPTMTTYTNSTIEQIDQDAKTVTFRTVQGESWSLQVTDADVLHGVQQGDRVSLELDANDRVKNIIKADEGRTGPSQGTPHQ